MKCKTPFYAVGLLVSLIGVGWMVYVVLNPSWRPRPIEADMLYIHSLNKIVSDIYTTTGRPLRSLDDLTQSSYYPFSPVRSPNGGQVNIRLSAQAMNYEWFFAITPTAKGAIMRRQWTETRLAPEKETRCRLGWLMSGTKRIIQQVRGWREEIKKSWSILAEVKNDTAAPSELSLPAIAKAYNRDALLQAEAYIHWLELIEGESPLLDRWGKPFRFRASQDFLIGMSAGADGEFGTTDDIVVRTKLQTLLN
jgi:hypothetical protein